MYTCGTAETERDGEIEKGVSVGGQLDTGLGSMHTALLPPPALGSPLPLPARSPSTALSTPSSVPRIMHSAPHR